MSQNLFEGETRTTSAHLTLGGCSVRTTDGSAASCPLATKQKNLLTKVTNRIRLLTMNTPQLHGYDSDLVSGAHCIDVKGE
jgi:hypothetical protein